MTQKDFKNWTGVSIGIPRKGWSSKRWLSPLTMQSAFHSTARLRNLISLGSLQESAKWTVTILFSALDNIWSIKLSRFAWDTYLLNLSRARTSLSSSSVSFEKISFPFFDACSTMIAGIPEGFSTELTRILVSKTNITCHYFAINPSKILRSRCDNRSIVSTSIPASAKSIANSNFSGPEGNVRPSNKASKAFSVRCFCISLGRFFQIDAFGSSNVIVTDCMELKFTFNNFNTKIEYWKL
jgi:hypothetical protein